MLAANTPARAIFRSSVRGERTRLGVFTTIVALMAAAVVIGYRDTYPTQADRLRFSEAFQGNLALRLFYGIPRDLGSVGGYAEFRLVGLLSVLVAGWAVFAAVRALRGEEESGRWELMLSGAVSRRAANASVLAALLVEWLLMWFTTSVMLVVVAVIPGDLSVGKAAALAFAILAPALLFGPVAALGCQILSTTRGAQAFGAGALALALLLRIAADTAGVGWLRWITPLGWAEELHPVTGARLPVFALLALAAVVVGLGTLIVAGRRDVGGGVWSWHREPRSRRTLLGSPTQAAIRDEIPMLLVWMGATGLFAALIGAFSKNIAEDAGRSGLAENSAPRSTPLPGTSLSAS